MTDPDPTLAADEALDPIDPIDPTPRSGRASLRAQREAATEGLYTDLKVPEYDDVWLRLRPVDAPAVRKKMRKYEADKDAGLLKAYCELLIDACDGIFHVTESGKEIGVDPDAPDSWPRYDERLAAILELTEEESRSAIAVARAFHVKDGHIYGIAGKLMEFSGFARSEIEERMRGN